MNRTIIAIAALAALAGCGNPATEEGNGVVTNNAMLGNEMDSSNGAMTNAMASPVANAPSDAATYLAKAGAGDLFEVESSKALIAKSTNANHKMFARMMIEAHMQSTAKLKAAATKAGLEPTPPVLDAEQQRMLDEIKGASADNVDALYHAHQATAHAAALALHKYYAEAGDTPALKTTAGEIVPVVEKHLAELDKLSAT
jgi:putative membrane protein